MKKRKVQNLELCKKTVSNLNPSKVKGGTGIYSMDIRYCTSGNVVSAILVCMEGYTEQVCNC